MRTCGPSAAAPQRCRERKLSLIAGITLSRVFFRIHEGSANGVRAAEFLQANMRNTSRKLLVIWAGDAIHRPQPFKTLLSASFGRLWLERLPGFAPELSKVGFRWSHLKQHGIQRILAHVVWELSHHAIRAYAPCADVHAQFGDGWIPSELSL